MKAKSWTLSLLIFLSGCGGSEYAARDAATQAGSVYGGLRLAVGATCPVTGRGPASAETAFLPAIGIALAGSAINVGLKAAGEALVAAGTDKTSYHPANTRIRFYKIGESEEQLAARQIANPPTGVNPVHAVQLSINPAASCIVLFVPDSDSKAATGDWGNIQRRQRMKTLKLPENQNPAFYFEARISLSEDKTKFWITPLELQYNKSFDGNASGQRDLMITFDWQTPGAEAGSAIATDRLTIPNIKIPSQIGSEGFGHFKMSYLPIPPVTEAIKTDITGLQADLALWKDGQSQPDRALSQLRRNLDQEKAKLQVEVDKDTDRKIDDARTRAAAQEIRRINNNIAAIQATIDQMEAALRLNAIEKRLSNVAEKAEELLPLNFRVVVAETREGSVLLKRMGEILQGATPGITEAAAPELKRLIDPTARRQSARLEVEAADNQDLAILEAELGVLNAMENLAKLSADAKPSEVAIAEQTLRIARFKANTAYVNAGRTPKYSDARP